MEINEINLLFERELNKNFFNTNNNDLPADHIKEINLIGIPNIVFDKFVPYNGGVLENRIIFSKSIISESFLGIDLPTSKVICFSNKFDTNSFVNTNFSSFVRAYFTYEIFRRLCLKSESLGPYYDNTPEGGNFEKYAVLLKKLISFIDEKAANEGVWHSLILEMSMGVI